MSDRTILIIEHRTLGHDPTREVVLEGLSDVEARALLWEVLKDMTPGGRQ